MWALLIDKYSFSVEPLSLNYPIFELNCFVHDDDPRYVFPVKITRTESVGTLKRSIKDDNPEWFLDIDARSLVLWKVSIPVNDSFGENMSRVELRDEDVLLPVDRLSKVFLCQPEDGDLHIIVHSLPAGEF